MLLTQARLRPAGECAVPPGLAECRTNLTLKHRNRSCHSIFAVSSCQAGASVLSCSYQTIASVVLHHTTHAVLAGVPRRVSRQRKRSA